MKEICRVSTNKRVQVESPPAPPTPPNPNPTSNAHMPMGHAGCSAEIAPLLHRALLRRLRNPVSRMPSSQCTDQNQEVDDGELPGGVEMNPHRWISDAAVMCLGPDRCKWRNGEFDELDDSAQIELEGANCSVECETCREWYHIHCVGFSSREDLPEEGDGTRSEER